MINVKMLPNLPTANQALFAITSQSNSTHVADGGKLLLHLGAVEDDMRLQAQAL